MKFQILIPWQLVWNLIKLYTCYLLAEESISKKLFRIFRLLETNKRVLLPSNTHLRLLVTSVDVLHSWAIPSFGVKIDACPED
jgi:heme/copper-type cytochrome/quinol oxidase subunit 2